MSSPSPRRPTTLAGRMGRWSAAHRKAAILGWFGFVILAIAVSVGVPQNMISDVDGFNGESHRAEQALDDSGLRPTSEAVFFQDRDLTIDDSAYRAAVQDATRTLRGVPYVRKIESPLSGGGQVTTDGHAALVEFEIKGDSDETADRVKPVLTAVDGVKARHPQLQIEQFGDASANKAVGDVINDDLARAGELSIPVTL